jgi:sarcosine oxidase subunit beta
MTTADVIIIGGGVHGASLAFHLALRGLEPLVLERGTLAAGATGRSSGLVRMHYDLKPEAELAWASFQYFRNWEERVGGDCGFRRTGFLQLVRPDHSQALRANVAMQQGLGIPTFAVSPDDVRRLAPSFFTEDFEVAAFEPESGYADPSATAAAFMSAARNRGGRLIQDCQVTGITIAAGAVQSVESSQGRFSAPVVVDAAGAWAGPVARLAGVEAPVDTWRHDTMFVRRPPALSTGHPTVIDDGNSMYFRPETGGLTLIGLEDGNPLGQSPDGDADHALPGFVERAVERICRRIPAMEAASLHSAHGGYDGISPDQRAILGPAGPDGFFLQCGFSGTGFKIAPAVGASMAAWIVDGTPLPVDLTPFGLSRFEEGRRLEGEHAYQAIWR